MMKTLLTSRVANLQGKKEVVVGAKISQGEFDALQIICLAEDRKMSYVLRELAMRGLAQYLQDRRIRITPEEEAIIRSGAKFDPVVSTPKEMTNEVEQKPKRQRKVR